MTSTPSPRSAARLAARAVPALVACLLLAPPASAQFETTEVSGRGQPPLLMTRLARPVPPASPFTWEDLGPVTYNVYRRQPGGLFECVASNLTTPDWAGDPQAPVSSVWLYTVNADDGWGENLHGSGIAIGARCACSGPPAVATSRLRLAPIYDPANDPTGSRIVAPVYLTSPPGDRSRLLVVEQQGRIALLKRGTHVGTRFLDIRPLVLAGGERGLLSMAFHPDYGTNGRFYVYYTASAPTGQVTVAEYYVTPPSWDVADTSRPPRIIYTCDHDWANNHNGGQLAFGPDGYLYIGIGDGGGSGDPRETGQDLGACLGKIHRLDVDVDPAAPPASNPYVATAGARPEIWAYGLRNPWRFSFDRVTGDLYIADVGQSLWEEVDVQPRSSPGGENYGWDEYEGDRHCFEAPCDPVGKTWPVVEYGHTEGLCSVTGGYVYRGCRIQGLGAPYFYIDYCGRSRAPNPAPYLWSFEYQGGGAANPLDWSSIVPSVGNWSSFGEDARGELYLLHLSSARIYRLEPE